MKRLLQPIDNGMKTLSGIAQERIRDAILKGGLKPGTRIDQNQLADELNTSLIPVREALKKLESEGFVQIIPRRGAFVVEFSMNDLEHLYEARMMLEGQVAARATAHLTEEQLEQLRELSQAMTEALNADRHDEFTQLNREFHFLIYNAADNHYLSDMLSGLWDLAERYRYRYLFIKGRHEVINAEHQEILDACCARDAERLRTAIESHIQQTLNGVRDLAAKDMQKA